jgi:hypothetical protein
MGEFANKEESNADKFNEARETTQVAAEVAHNLGQLKEMFPVLQGVGGAMSTVDGIRDMARGNYADGGIKAAGGLRDSGQAAAEMAGKTRIAGALDKVGPFIDGLSAANHFRKGEYADGILDSANTVVGVAAPAVAPALKLGEAVGGEFNRSAAEYNEYGGNRTLSQAGGEIARDFGESMEAKYGRSDVTNNAKGAVIAEKTVANTVDAALTAVTMPPMVRERLAELRARAGKEGDGGIAGMGFGIEDVVGLPGVGAALPGFSHKQENNGPTYLDMLNRFNGQSTQTHEDLKRRNDATQRNAATTRAVFGTDPEPAPSPYAGMYEHTDHVRK